MHFGWGEEAAGVKMIPTRYQARGEPVLLVVAAVADIVRNVRGFCIRVLHERRQLARRWQRYFSVLQSRHDEGSQHHSRHQA